MIPITDDDVVRAVDWMRDNADNAAEARATRDYLDGYTKVLKSVIMRENPAMSLGAQETVAYADQRYLEHLDALRIAIERDEKYRWLRTAAEAKLEAWRTMNANNRILGKI